MKTYQLLTEREIEETALEAQADLSLLDAREPKRALSLSLIPGLGQLYNGETGKGILFLAVTLANLALVSLLFFTAPLLNSLFHLAAGITHAAPKFELEQILDLMRSGRAVTFTYLALILSYGIYAARDAYDRARDKRRGVILRPFALTLPEATSGSYLFHFSIICTLLLMVVFFAQPPKPHRQVTEIALVQEEKKTSAPPRKAEAPKPKPAPRVEPKKEVVQPPRQEQVKPPPPKPVPVAVAVPTDKPVADPVVQSNEAAPEPAATAPPSDDSASSSAGSPTGKAGQQASGDGEDVDFSSYLTEIQKRIKKNWHPPRGAESLTVTVKFKILKDGSLGSIKMVRTSGLMPPDDAARAAISASAPFPPLPAGAGDDVDIKFTFDYNVFNGKMK